MSWAAFAAVSPIDPQREPDPYACWAAATRGAYLASHAGPRCRLALQMKGNATIKKLRGDPRLAIPGIYCDDVQHCTAEVSGADEAFWSWLHGLANVALAEPGMARPDDPPLALDPIRASTSRGLASRRAKGDVVIGVVDGACGFANRQFRCRAGKAGPWQTRLAGFWDQQGDAGGAGATTGWSRPPDLGYGRELQLDALDGLLAAHLANPADDTDDETQAAGERAIYRALGVALPDAADWTHATHVLDTVGGAPARADPSKPGNLRDKDGLPVPSADVEAADLIVVQLPEVALRDTSGRWAAALVLDGLRYIVARAGQKARIVVNLSLGSFAGPHDGSSMLERAIDSLIGKHNGRLTVVVAAGNAGEPRDDSDGTIRRCHASAGLAPKGETDDHVTLSLDIDVADATETFVELWLAPTSNGKARVTVELEPPDGSEAVKATCGEVATRRLDGSDSGSVALAQVVNLTGRDGLGVRGKAPMALVAIGTTRAVAGYRAPVGRWNIGVSNEGSEPVALEAWVERRDVPGELAGERPQYGFGEGDRVALLKTNTLGSLANGAETIVVTAAEFPVDREAHIAALSSVGPDSSSAYKGRRKALGKGPVVAAPCEIVAAGFLSGSTKTLKGTSMSAAWVTREIAARFIVDGPPKGGVRTWLEESLKPGASRGAARHLPSSFIVQPDLEAEL